ncbi:unnamed protein product [Amoebophrya sp. A120]|nr:unnamed protein product [Amoebophrya sp. A120]|eukprot:GSA120T00014013001.1
MWWPHQVKHQHHRAAAPHRHDERMRRPPFAMLLLKTLFLTPSFLQQTHGFLIANYFKHWKAQRSVACRSMLLEADRQLHAGRKKKKKRRKKPSGNAAGNKGEVVQLLQQTPAEEVGGGAVAPGGKDAAAGGAAGAADGPAAAPGDEAAGAADAGEAAASPVLGAGADAGGGLAQGGPATTPQAEIIAAPGAASAAAQGDADAESAAPSPTINKPCTCKNGLAATSLEEGCSTPGEYACKSTGCSSGYYFIAESKYCSKERGRVFETKGAASSSSSGAGVKPIQLEGVIKMELVLKGMTSGNDLLLDKSWMKSMQEFICRDFGIPLEGGTASACSASVSLQPPVLKHLPVLDDRKKGTTTPGTTTALLQETENENQVPVPAQGKLQQQWSEEHDLLEQAGDLGDNSPVVFPGTMDNYAYNRNLTNISGVIQTDALNGTYLYPAGDSLTYTDVYEDPTKEKNRLFKITSPAQASDEDLAQQKQVLQEDKDGIWSFAMENSVVAKEGVFPGALNSIKGEPYTYELADGKTRKVAGSKQIFNLAPATANNLVKFANEIAKEERNATALHRIGQTAQEDLLFENSQEKGKKWRSRAWLPDRQTTLKVDTEFLRTKNSLSFSVAMNKSAANSSTTPYNNPIISAGTTSAATSGSASTSPSVVTAAPSAAGPALLNSKKHDVDVEEKAKTDEEEDYEVVELEHLDGKTEDFPEEILREATTDGTTEADVVSLAEVDRKINGERKIKQHQHQKPFFPTRVEDLTLYKLPEAQIIPEFVLAKVDAFNCPQVLGANFVPVSSEAECRKAADFFYPSKGSSIDPAVKNQWTPFGCQRLAPSGQFIFNQPQKVNFDKQLGQHRLATQLVCQMAHFSTYKKPTGLLGAGSSEQSGKDKDGEANAEQRKRLEKLVSDPLVHPHTRSLVYKLLDKKKPASKELDFTPPKYAFDLKYISPDSYLYVNPNALDLNAPCRDSLDFRDEADLSCRDWAVLLKDQVGKQLKSEDLRTCDTAFKQISFHVDEKTGVSNSLNLGKVPYSKFGINQLLCNCPIACGLGSRGNCRSKECIRTCTVDNGPFFPLTPDSKTFKPGDTANIGPVYNGPVHSIPGFCPLQTGLEVGKNCVHSYQCHSGICCPFQKMCLLEVMKPDMKAVVKSAKNLDVVSLLQTGETEVEDASARENAEQETTDAELEDDEALVAQGQDQMEEEEGTDEQAEAKPAAAPKESGKFVSKKRTAGAKGKYKQEVKKKKTAAGQNTKMKNKENTSQEPDEVTLSTLYPSANGMKSVSELTSNSWALRLPSSNNQKVFHDKYLQAEPVCLGPISKDALMMWKQDENIEKNGDFTMISSNKQKNDIEQIRYCDTPNDPSLAECNCKMSFLLRYWAGEWTSEECSAKSLKKSPNAALESGVLGENAEDKEQKNAEKALMTSAKEGGSTFGSDAGDAAGEDAASAATAAEAAGEETDLSLIQTAKTSYSVLDSTESYDRQDPAPAAGGDKDDEKSSSPYDDSVLKPPRHYNVPPHRSFCQYFGDEAASFDMEITFPQIELPLAFDGKDAYSNIAISTAIRNALNEIPRAVGVVVPRYQKLRLVSLELKPEPPAGTSLFSEGNGEKSVIPKLKFSYPSSKRGPPEQPFDYSKIATKEYKAKASFGSSGTSSAYKKQEDLAHAKSSAQAVKAATMPEPEIPNTKQNVTQPEPEENSIAHAKAEAVMQKAYEEGSESQSNSTSLMLLQGRATMKNRNNGKEENQNAESASPAAFKLVQKSMKMKVRFWMNLLDMPDMLKALQTKAVRYALMRQIGTINEEKFDSVPTEIQMMLDSLSATWPQFAPCAIPKLLNLGYAAVTCHPALANHFKDTIFQKFGDSPIQPVWLLNTIPDEVKKKPEFDAAKLGNNIITAPFELKQTKEDDNSTGAGAVDAATNKAKQKASEEVQLLFGTSKETKRTRHKKQRIQAEATDDVPVKVKLLGSENVEVLSEVTVPFLVDSGKMASGATTSAAVSIQPGQEENLLRTANALLYNGEPYRTLNTIKILPTLPGMPSAGASLSPGKDEAAPGDKNDKPSGTSTLSKKEKAAAMQKAKDASPIHSYCPESTVELFPNTEKAVCVDQVCNCEGGGEPAVGKQCPSTEQGEPGDKCVSCPAGTAFADFENSKCLEKEQVKQKLNGKVPNTPEITMFEAPAAEKKILPATQEEIMNNQGVSLANFTSAEDKGEMEDDEGDLGAGAVNATAGTGVGPVNSNGTAKMNTSSATAAAGAEGTAGATGGDEAAVAGAAEGGDAAAGAAGAGKPDAAAAAGGVPPPNEKTSGAPASPAGTTTGSTTITSKDGTQKLTCPPCETTDDKQELENLVAKISEATDCGEYPMNAYEDCCPSCGTKGIEPTNFNCMKCILGHDSGIPQVCYAMKRQQLYDSVKDQLIKVHKLKGDPKYEVCAEVVDSSSADGEKKKLELDEKKKADKMFKIDKALAVSSVELPGECDDYEKAELLTLLEGPFGGIPDSDEEEGEAEDSEGAKESTEEDKSAAAAENTGEPKEQEELDPTKVEDPFHGTPVEGEVTDPPTTPAPTTTTTTTTAAPVVLDESQRVSRFVRFSGIPKNYEQFVTGVESEGVPILDLGYMKREDITHIESVRDDHYGNSSEVFSVLRVMKMREEIQKEGEKTGEVLGDEADMKSVAASKVQGGSDENGADGVGSNHIFLGQLGEEDDTEFPQLTNSNDPDVSSDVETIMQNVPSGKWRFQYKNRKVRYRAYSPVWLSDGTDISSLGIKLHHGILFAFTGRDVLQQHDEYAFCGSKSEALDAQKVANNMGVIVICPLADKQYGMMRKKAKGKKKKEAGAEATVPAATASSGVVQEDVEKLPAADDAAAPKQSEAAGGPEGASAPGAVVAEGQAPEDKDGATAVAGALLQLNQEPVVPPAASSGEDEEAGTTAVEGTDDAVAGSEDKKGWPTAEIAADEAAPGPAETAKAGSAPEQAKAEDESANNKEDLPKDTGNGIRLVEPAACWETFADLGAKGFCEDPLEVKKPPKDPEDDEDGLFSVEPVAAPTKGAAAGPEGASEESPEEQKAPAAGAPEVKESSADEAAADTTVAEAATAAAEGAAADDEGQAAEGEAGGGPTVVVQSGGGPPALFLQMGSSGENVEEQERQAAEKLNSNQDQTPDDAEVPDFDSYPSDAEAMIALIQHSQDLLTFMSNGKITKPEVFVLGFSGGGAMAYRLACEEMIQSDLTGIIVVSYDFFDPAIGYKVPPAMAKKLEKRPLCQPQISSSSGADKKSFPKHFVLHGSYDEALDIPEKLTTNFLYYSSKVMECQLQDFGKTSALYFNQEKLDETRFGHLDREMMVCADFLSLKIRDASIPKLNPFEKMEMLESKEDAVHMQISCPSRLCRWGKAPLYATEHQPALATKAAFRGLDYFWNNFPDEREAEELLKKQLLDNMKETQAGVEKAVVDTDTDLLADEKTRRGGGGGVGNDSSATTGEEEDLQSTSGDEVKTLQEAPAT